MTLLSRRTAAAERLWLAHADAIGLAVDRQIVGVWGKLRGILAKSQGHASDYQRALHALRPLPTLITNTLGIRLDKLYRDAHRLTARNVVGSLTIRGLKRVSDNQHRRLGNHVAQHELQRASQTSEGLRPAISVLHRESIQLTEDEHSSGTQAILAAFRRLSGAQPSYSANYLSLVDLRREAGLSREAFDAALRELRFAGTLTLAAAEGRHGISAAEREAGIEETGSLLLYVSVVGGVERLPSTEPVLPRDVSNLVGLEKPTDRSGWEAYIGALIFPPPSEETVWRALAPLVQPEDWQEIGDHTRKLPQNIAKILAAGASQGQSQRSITDQLAPYFEGLRYKARRTARTFGLHIAHVAQEEAYAGLGEDLVGFQVHSVFAEQTRPWHAKRSGTIYYVNPKPGQKGLRQCPHPPLEAEDASERPAGASHIAWHCMCWLTPVLRGLEELAS